MLELKNIVKTYITGDNVVAALDGVSLCFRENEFVSILGASGCGKTTLLNIVGGLDRYTDGDLVINGKSTKLFRDGDWDVYRNHSIGFVFQSYNLISHQTVLSNVELALTISGVSKSERRQRAISALEQVGLGDQLHKKPNQMSGGQMQRVAIARALVNNPDILLADEPTGALDTQTSVQIMELLKEVAKDRLVIMVTHNPELAEEYSTRIVRLSDGKVVDDTNPLGEEEYEAFAEKDKAALIEKAKNKKLLKAENKKKSMSVGTAISLSFKNLLTKKGRTVLTSFAGSIGIIGIALILSLSNGINIFIEQVQEDTLSTFPLTIQKQAQDTEAMMNAMTSVSDDAVTEKDPNKLYVDDELGTLMEAMSSMHENDLVSFKEYIDNHETIKDYTSDIQYTYDLNLSVYSVREAEGKKVVSKLGLEELLKNMGEIDSTYESFSSLLSSSGMASGMDIMSEMIDNQELLDQQYEIVKGSWPKSAEEVVLVVGKDNKISKMTLYMLGEGTLEQLEYDMQKLNTDKTTTENTTDFSKDPLAIGDSYDIDSFIGKEFKLLTATDFYRVKSTDENGFKVWEKVSETDDELLSLFDTNATTLKISGIIRPKDGVTTTSISGAIGYSKMLTDKLITKANDSDIIKQQKEQGENGLNVLTGKNFDDSFKTKKETLMLFFMMLPGSSLQSYFPEMTTMAQEHFKANPLINDDTFMLLASGMLPQSINDAALDIVLDTFAKQGNEAQAAALCLSIGQSFTGEYKPAITDVGAIKYYYSLLSTEQKGMVFTMFSMLGNEDKAEAYGKINQHIEGCEINASNYQQLIPLFITYMEETDANVEMVDKYLKLFQTYLPYDISTTYDAVLASIGDVDKAEPASINIYAKDFAAKDEIINIIEEYNQKMAEEDTEGEVEKKIEYSDLVGTLMSSVSLIINVISYVLIAFVSISLVVSSIMIGIITNISVLERTKEIGILRAIGASKKDISRVFNAETFIIGLAAGCIGIVVTLVFCLFANVILQAIPNIPDISAVLPWWGAVLLIIISMVLTILAGLIPAKKASRQDPVIALRTE